MLRFGILLTVVVGIGLWAGQATTPLTPDKPIPIAYESKITLPSGKTLDILFELVPTGEFVDGPRVIVPCVGPSEEANLRGWRDDSLAPVEYAWDAHIRRGIKDELKVGGQAGEEGRQSLRRDQTRIETDLTKLFSVKPGEGSGPRPNEEVYRYRYQRVHLTVRLGKRDYVYRLSTYFIPVAQPVLESKRPCGEEPKETACSMGGFGTPAGTYTLPPVDRSTTGYIGAVYDVDMAEKVAKSEFMVTGVDINSATISDVKFADVPSLRWIFLPSGTVLVPGKEGVQSMITVDPTLLRPSQFVALTQGDLPEKSIAVHCLELEKKPPDSSVKFSLGRASDPVLRNLAMFTQRSAIRGPWDQARLWIYTDKASLDRVNKRLALGCPPGMYVRSLWEVNSVGGLRDQDLASTEFFRPEYLGAVSNRKEAATWLTGILASHHRAALIQYLAGGGKELAALITSTNPLAPAQFIRTTKQLLTHQELEVRIAMLKFLDAQDIDTLKKAVGKPAPNWDRHTEEEGEEGELGKRMKEKWGG